MIYALGLLIGALAFRIRGDAIFERFTGRGKTTADACWALVLGSLGFVAGLPWWIAGLLALGLFVGGRLPWYRSLSLGRNPVDGPVLGQVVRHALRGMVWVLPAAIVVGLAGAPWMPLLVAGLCCVPAWEIGFRLNLKQWWLHPTEVGEWLFGAAIGLAVVITGDTYVWTIVPTLE